MLMKWSQEKGETWGRILLCEPLHSSAISQNSQPSYIINSLLKFLYYK